MCFKVFNYFSHFDIAYTNNDSKETKLYIVNNFTYNTLGATHMPPQNTPNYCSKTNQTIIYDIKKVIN